MLSLLFQDHILSGINFMLFNLEIFIIDHDVERVYLLFKDDTRFPSGPQ